MTDKERLEEIDQIVDDLYSDRIEIHNFVQDSLEQAEQVQELEEQNEKVRQDFLKIHELWLGTQQNEHDLQEENKRYRKVLESVRSEIKYALYSNKSEDVKRHYLQNAEREATEALEDSKC